MNAKALHIGVSHNEIVPIITSYFKNGHTAQLGGPKDHTAQLRGPNDNCSDKAKIEPAKAKNDTDLRIRDLVQRLEKHDN